jgi:CRISPR-associated protein Csd1
VSLLAALAEAHERLAAEGAAPPYGYSSETIGWVIGLEPDGAVANVAPLGDGKTGVPLDVPQGVKRSSGVASNFLWDKTGYVLGIAALQRPNEDAAAYAKRVRRLPETHAAFVALHRDALEGAEDEGLRALLAFLERWRPEAFEELGWPDAMRDQNVVFALERERLDRVFLHDRPAARALQARRLGAGESAARACLVSGEPGPVARLHPSVRGVWGAQSSGASMVSFNLEAFESYGAKQGDNAPVSERAAFAYGAALNAFLAKGSPNRIQIGDASTVFWASGPKDDAALAEASFDAILGGGETTPRDFGVSEDAIRGALDAIRRGRPADAPDLPQGVRLHVLGLAPNAARLSVRFWLQEDFGRVAGNLARFAQDMAIDPPPDPPHPGFWRYLGALSARGKLDNLPPNLAGEWLRAVLTGAPYPMTLMTTALMRARTDKRVGPLRAAMLKAVLRRNFREEAPVGLDPDNDKPAYQLGRLFAVLEQAQRAALGRVNATIGDRYYAAASSTPARVFGPLLRSLRVHISDAERRGRGGWIAPKVGEIMLKLPPELPKSLPLEDQARFAVGYYHEKATRHGKPAEVVENPENGADADE